MGGNTSCVINVTPSTRPLMFPVLAEAVVVKVSAHRKKKNHKDAVGCVLSSGKAIHG